MIIGGLTFRIYPLSKSLPLVEGFQILLSDRDSENIFHKDRFNLDGVELKTSIKEPGYKLYDLKIYKEIYLEDHDNFRCKNYANFGDYNSVRRTHTREFISLIDLLVFVPALSPAECVPDVLCSALDDRGQGALVPGSGQHDWRVRYETRALM